MAWNPKFTNYLAAAYDKSRSDHSILIFDTSLAPPSQTEASSSAVAKIVSKSSTSKVKNSLTNLNIRGPPYMFSDEFCPFLTHLPPRQMICKCSHNYEIRFGKNPTIWHDLWTSPYQIWDQYFYHRPNWLIWWENLYFLNLLGLQRKMF